MGRTIDFSEFLAISASVTSDEMMARVLSHSRRLTGAEAGTIFLVRREGVKKWLEATHFQNNRIPVPKAVLRVPLNSASIAGYAAETGHMLR
ncbi:MAG: transcriptional regulator, partial [Planctomycetes bacterium]|nr:transcriptional regulator [Planctomycetota bacterium]